MFDGRVRMNEFGRITRISTWVLSVLTVLQTSFFISWSLNDEGIALLRFKEKVVNDPFQALSSWKDGVEETGHCSWFGIECVDGHVVSLNLQNMRLKGTLSPELRHLSHIKYIIFRNNLFSGRIPEEIKDLKALELLDLGLNSLSEPLEPELQYSVRILLDDNGLSSHTSLALEELNMPSELHLKGNHLVGAAEPYNRYDDWTKDVHSRRLMRQLEGRVPPVQRTNHIGNKDQHDLTKRKPPSLLHGISKLKGPSLPPNLINKKRSPAPPKLFQDSPLSISPAPLSDTSTSSASTSSTIPPPSPSSNSSPSSQLRGKTRSKLPIALGAMGGSIFLALVILGIYLWRSNKITTVGPWRTGLSGQLKRAFVTGIQNLKRNELETACEDFSNVVGTSSIGTIYKGTLSNGVEIAVISLAVTSAKDWSRNLETQFRRKIETLSMVNHKNFVNLIGYCEEAEPFTRMMVFEYAPNGSLFEHLHVKEAEHLDWGMRLRVAMGLAYCLDYMHSLDPPVPHPNLNSSAVNLSEDYATKLSDFCFWNEVAAAAQAQPIGMDSLSTTLATPETNVYNFGLILLELMTGQIPICIGGSSVEDWVLGFLSGNHLLEELVDPILRQVDPEQLEKISEVGKKCLKDNPQDRATMKEVAARFREITGIDRDKAYPRLSPLWWAELEIQSVDGE